MMTRSGMLSRWLLVGEWRAHLAQAISCHLQSHWEWRSDSQFI